MKLFIDGVQVDRWTVQDFNYELPEVDPDTYDACTHTYQTVPTQTLPLSVTLHYYYIVYLSTLLGRLATETN